MCINCKLWVVAAFSLFIVGCANTNPIIDTKGIDMQAYRIDLAECKQYVAQVNAGEEAAIDAGIGAAFGWAVSKITGGDTKRDASLGALTAGSKGLGSAAKSKEQIIRRCLRGRGYNVLN